MKNEMKQSQDSRLHLVYEYANTTPEKLDEDLKIVREWLKFQPHLPNQIGDNVIRQFILGSKNNIEKAKSKLDNYFSLRHEIPEFFQNRDATSSEFKNTTYITSYICQYPKLSKEGCRTTVLSFAGTELSPHYNPQVDLKRLFMINDLWLTKGTLFCGENVILDLKNFNEKFRQRLQISTLIQWIKTLSLLPTRLNKFIVINSPSFIHTIFNLVKPFLSEKLQKRVFIYSDDYKVLGEHYSVEELPADLGGQLDVSVSDLSEFWREELFKHADWMKTDANFFSNESKRPIDKSSSTFGVEGTFRKINLD